MHKHTQIHKPGTHARARTHTKSATRNKPGPYLGQDVLSGEFSHDEAVFVRSLLMASVNDQTVVLSLDLDLVRLEVLNVDVDTELFVSVDHLKISHEQ